MRQPHLIYRRFCAASSRALSLAPGLVTITAVTIACAPLVTLAAPWETTRTIAIQDSLTGKPLGALKLSVADLNGDTSIKVSGPLPLDAAQLQLEKPPRLVLDLAGLGTGRFGKISVTGHPTVAGIRISSHEDKLRIVVDLLKEIGFNYSFSKRGSEAGFTLRGATAPAVETRSLPDEKKELPSVESPITPTISPIPPTPTALPAPAPLEPETFELIAEPDDFQTSTDSTDLVAEAIVPLIPGSASTPLPLPTDEPRPYDPTGKRDPFKPFFLNDVNEQDLSKPPLERYELSQLKLTAVVGSGADFNSASLEDSSGRGFIVRKGSRVGAHAGIVTEILRDRITVVETITDASGKQRQRPVVLKLRAQEPEGPEYVEAR